MFRGFNDVRNHNRLKTPHCAVGLVLRERVINYEEDNLSLLEGEIDFVINFGPPDKISLSVLLPFRVPFAIL